MTGVQTCALPISQNIALVDSNDNVIGYEEKHLVHSKGLLHRAFSIIVFNPKGELLLQRRALDKYHSAGLWTNTCCSHLPEDAVMEEYIHNRLLYEMGFDCELRFATKFHYHVDFGNGMIENEIDYVYTGIYDGSPTPNPKEVCNWAWLEGDFILKDIVIQPEKYTYWFKNILENHFDLIKKNA